MYKHMVKVSLNGTSTLLTMEEASQELVESRYCVTKLTARKLLLGGVVIDNLTTYEVITVTEE